MESVVIFFPKNKAVFTATSVTCGWGGAVKSLCKPQNIPKQGWHAINSCESSACALRAGMCVCVSVYVSQTHANHLPMALEPINQTLHSRFLP